MIATSVVNEARNLTECLRIAGRNRDTPLNPWGLILSGCVR